MPRSRNLRRRPSTPDLKSAQSHQDQHLTADPTSPPETPTPSPPASRKHSLKPRRQPDFRDIFKPLNEDPNIKPVGTGHQFSYQPTLGPEQLSPRSSSSSSSDLDDSDDDSSDSASIGSVREAAAPGLTLVLDNDDSEDEMMEDSESSEDSDSSSSESDASDASDEAETSHLTATTTTVVCNFTVEDVDPMDSDCDGLDILQPTEIESNRSRSRSRHKTVPHKDLDKDMMHNLKNLNCSNETSDNEADNEATGEADLDFDEEAFLKRREQIRKFRRMSMGSSFGKRTHSELSDSDNDDEALDVNEVGSSARRLRRKLQRTSLLFHDPPPARIEELEEPDSSEDEYAAGQHLARELPYWDMEIMEMDSSSS
ncbi:hypothetical protein AK830_g12619 [Neonectria ditissima]|uniref:Uncharacterized protein n=1 Tax=Neonectria ditissima TaxID=78410 RepID=A0A0P7AJW6_9HYPO|nr:hypothetical protein AK830_g12619 [Neonectria ditissima]